MMILDKQTIQKRAPAVYGYPADHMSQQYGQVHTEKVIDQLSTLGYQPIAARQDKPSKRDPMTVRHMVEFMPSGWLGRKPQEVGDEMPRLTFVNSHNGRTKARFYAGFFRLVCLNGLVVGEPDAVSELFHSRDVMEFIESSVENITAHMDRRMEVIDSWKNLTLKEPQRHEFARAAKVIRFGERAEAYTEAEVLQFRRNEDKAPTLWNTYNTVQENLMSKSLEGKSSTGRGIRSRPITNIGPDMEINAALWSLASDTALKLAA